MSNEYFSFLSLLICEDFHWFSWGFFRWFEDVFEDVHWFLPPYKRTTCISHIIFEDFPSEFIGRLWTNLRLFLWFFDEFDWEIWISLCNFKDFCSKIQLFWWFRVFLLKNLKVHLILRLFIDVSMIFDVFWLIFRWYLMFFNDLRLNLIVF